MQEDLSHMDNRNHRNKKNKNKKLNKEYANKTKSVL